MLELYKSVSFKISEIITKQYSTSFSLATSFLEKEKREAIFAIYGFVRLSDEIVDTFHNFDKEKLLNELEEDLQYALKHRISSNPVLFAFAETVIKYSIPYDLIDAFLSSMKSDLNKSIYSSREEIKKYIYGSADVVGLMCLKVFVDGDEHKYHELYHPAMSLGSAFQKVNFLRDLNFDNNQLSRIYFPELINQKFTDEVKKQIITDIENDFSEAINGIRKLEGRARFAVLAAYYYYRSLISRIDKLSADKVMQQRVSVPNFIKLLLTIKSFFVYKLRLL
ncbi:MAG: phytoene/squalene synthase family protein [Ignavibacteria bacterium]|nr:phytoene/squalene synthase family protein [Ignavibacteria bacterium]